MIEIRHQVPGRLRLHVPVLHRNAGLATRIVATLRADAGVDQARANPACGSLVIQFDPTRWTGPAIEARLRGLLQQAGALPAAAVRPALTVQPPRLRPGPQPIQRRTPPRPSRTLSRAAVRTSLADRLGLRPTIAPPEAPSLLCRVNLRITRWMLRTSLRAWWHEQAAETATRGAERAAQPSLSAAWAYQLSQPLLNGPTGEGPQGVSRPPALGQRLAGWWRQLAAPTPRLLDASGDRMA
ncbi:HMA2 domain-containing protein [Thiococcus pfennigii]|jgi:hypothetical protein|uniref:HMA2 domain-containing protein n=1 Tax=Thiococcus pfennigii TaxID=1057 RepID=UPI001905783A|nr:hypothetical protein [Thiococcus pfennigii]MBK1732849.1 hypothetical protein [Thiococcus pfennigii]